jgi:allene oxide cyclase-like protein
MATKRALTAGLGISVAASAAVVTPLLFGSAAAAGSQSFTVVAHHLSDTTVDNGRKGFSAGDYDVHTDRLTQSGHRVGWDTGNCLTTRVGAKSSDQTCEFVLHLKHGQIDASGAVRSGRGGPGTFPLAIAGGTGRYADARGEIKITATNGPVPIAVQVRY